MELRRLEIGESQQTSEIEAREKFGLSGLRVEKGERYAFAVEITEPLRDKKIPVDDTDGFSTRSQKGLTALILRLSRPLRRSRKHKWFHLMGTVDRSESNHFPIGTGGEREMPASGELFVFLNDVPVTYRNNHGRFRLEIQRVG